MASFKFPPKYGVGLCGIKATLYFDSREFQDICSNPDVLLLSARGRRNVCSATPSLDGYVIDHVFCLCWRVAPCLPCRCCDACTSQPVHLQGKYAPPPTPIHTKGDLGSACQVHMGAGTTELCRWFDIGYPACLAQHPTNPPGHAPGRGAPSFFELPDCFIL